MTQKIFIWQMGSGFDEFAIGSIADQGCGHTCYAQGA